MAANGTASNVVVKEESLSEHDAGVKRTLKEELMDEDDDQVPHSKLLKKDVKSEMSRQCPYLDTIDRNVLDFGKSLKNWLGYSRGDILPPNA